MPLLTNMRSRLLGGGRVKYLLRDEFTTDRAAGAVNGTAAEPGPGTRSIVDGSNLVSVGLDELRIAIGGSSSNPFVAYGPYTRTAGLCLVCNFRCDKYDATAALTASIGFDNDGVGRVEANRLNFDAAAHINMARAGYFGAYTLVGSYSAMVNYAIAIVILSTKAAYCIKGGAWADWTLIGSEDLHAATTLYAALNTYNRAAAVKNIAVTVLPAPWQSDDVLTGGVLSAAAISALSRVAPVQLHTTATIATLFANAAGSGAGIERSGNDYWLWHGLQGGYRWYVKLAALTSPSTIHALNDSKITLNGSTVVALNTGGSVWEYAITVASVGDFVGNAHGYDYEASLAIAVDGQPVTLADGQAVTGTAVQVVRVSEIRNGATHIADMTTTYGMSAAAGLTVACAATWAAPAPSSGDLAMLPFDDTGGDTGFVVTPAGRYENLTLYTDTILNYTAQTADCAVGFRRGGNCAVMMQTNAARSMYLQDRGTLNKIYASATSFDSFSTTYRAAQLASTADLLR